MSKFTSIVRDMSSEKFIEVVGYSARKAREVYFHRHGIRKGKKSNQLKNRNAEKEDRAAALYTILQENEDEEMVEEMLRTWLLSKRTLLAAALDHLGIEHNEGLTDSDEVKRFEELKGKDVKAMVKALKAVSDDEADVSAYLRFMGIPASELN